MHEAHVGRHQILHAVAEDRVGMAAAELHDIVGARRDRPRGRWPRPVPARDRRRGTRRHISWRAPSANSVSGFSPASRIRASVRSASSGDSRCRAKPTWTSTKSPTETSSSSATEISFLTGPSATMAVSRFSSIDTISAGSARHMRQTPYRSRGRELAVAGRRACAPPAATRSTPSMPSPVLAETSSTLIRGLTLRALAMHGSGVEIEMRQQIDLRQQHQIGGMRTYRDTSAACPRPRSPTG